MLKCKLEHCMHASAIPKELHWHAYNVLALHIGMHTMF